VTYMITRRCTQRQFLMRPDDETNNAFIYCLAEAASRGATLREVEAAYIEEVLKRTRGNKTAAARILGIHRKTLHEKLRTSGGGSTES